jgi:hypothetical protein
VIGAGVCLVLACSCSTTPDWNADDSIRPPLPAETSFNKGAGCGDLLYLWLRFESGGELLFAVDTGAPVTVLDKSFESKLGKRIGSVELRYSGYGIGNGGAYRAPKLYLGSTRLHTGNWIATEDLSRFPFPNPSVSGILGMDCLRHYCVQLDFAARKIRFLDPDGLKNEELGNEFPLTFSSRSVFVEENLLGVKGANSLIDAGDNSDGALAPKLFQQALEDHHLTNQVKRRNFGLLTDSAGSVDTPSRKAFFPRGVFRGETYSDLRLWEDSGGNTIGLRFLARHLVTFNFPKRIMYLKRQSVGPLIDEGSFTNAAPGIQRDEEPKTATPALSVANP